MDGNLSEGVGLQSELKHREKLLREQLEWLKKTKQTLGTIVGISLQSIVCSEKEAR